MYAVIFRASIRQLDAEYSDMASQLRQLALADYGCLEFTALTEGDEEIAISYWSDLEQIKRWKQDPLHLQAQRMGKQQWYRDYQVQVVEILRDYPSEDRD
ncbi:MAG: DUF4188 domain-containing protein [Gammaproteobacteria bacterium]|nr:DUF4188 domain-containing protein [Gammaproteobacteria bacterium]